MKHIYYKNDFAVEITLLNASGEVIAPPEWQWHIEFTDGRRKYICSVDKGNANVVGNTIMCYLDNHKFCCGEIGYKFVQAIPDLNYLDGFQNLITPKALPIELWEKESDNDVNIQSSVVPAYVVYDAYMTAKANGYTGTSEEFYDALIHIVDINTAEAERVEAEANRVTAEQQRVENFVAMESALTTATTKANTATTKAEEASKRADNSATVASQASVQATTATKRANDISADLEAKREADYWRGAKGENGEKGEKGEQGIQGIQGEKGDDGFSPIVSLTKQGAISTLSITDAQGEHTTEISDGAKGDKGEKGDKGDTGAKGDRGEKGDQGERGLQGVQGVKGDDGVSPTVTTSKTGKVTTIEITDANGVHTATVNDGDSVEVVQSTGTSTTSVMSQKATTDELQGKQDKDVLQYRTPKVGTIYIGNKEYSNDCICYEEFFAVTPNSLIKLHVESDLKIRVTEYTNDKTYIKQSSYANINALLLGDSTKYIRLSATYASRGYDANNPITIDAYKDGDFGYYANAIESINHEINSIIDALNKKQNHTPRIICSDPSAISLPNIDTTKKELDFGVDSIVVTRDNNYILKNLDASGSYRKVSYASATSSALKLIFNVTTYKFSFIAYSQAIPTDSILIGAMRAIGSTDAALSVPFEYTVNGKYRKQDVVVGNEWVPLVWKDGYFNSNGGISTSSTNFNEKYTENYISIEDQLQRCVLAEIDAISNIPWVGIAYYKRDKSFISRQVYNTTWTYEDGNKKYLLVDFDYPTDAVYLRVSLRTYNNANTYVVAKESILVNLWKSAIKATTSLSKESFVKGINHRGYNTIAPENTLSAFRLSAEKGFNTVECDVSFTSDNVPVILHDSTIDRTSNGTGNITQMTLEQVRQYDFGSWKSQDYVGEKIPTLDEFLVLCRNKGLNVYIEIKSSGAYTEQQLRMIVDKVHGYGMRDKVSYISFSISFLQTIHAIDPLARLGYIATPSESSLQSILALRGYNEIFIDSSSYTNNDCDLCKQAGVPLEIWTINNQSTISSLNTYISGVTSDNLNASKIVYNIS